MDDYDPADAKPEAELLASAESTTSLLWPSTRPDKASDWHGHVSFGHWLVAQTRPKVVVELNTRNGVSFASFCEAVKRTGYKASCYAMDVWPEDPIAGFNGQEVYVDLYEFCVANYDGIAKLVRCRFDDAATMFADRSVDLLHIDGFRSFGAVGSQYEMWLAKMSPCGVILFHDTEIRHAEFGVWRFWAVVSEMFPNFSFRHSAGLGVLAVGPEVPEVVRHLCSQRFVSSIERVRDTFAGASEAAQSQGFLELMRNPPHPRLVRGVNIALGRLALQSSFPTDIPESPGGAVDGRKTGLFGFHTALEDGPWWMVDLGRNETIDEVLIYNRLDGVCAERARTLTVLTSVDGEVWSELYAHNGQAFGGANGRPLRISCPGASARFLRTKLRERQYLHLDEVEVYRYNI